MPVEVVPIGGLDIRDIESAIAVANSSQDEFSYSRLAPEAEKRFGVYAFQHIRAAELLDLVERERNSLRGYHPFLLAVTDAYLDGTVYSNLFGESRGTSGVGVVTIANVPDIIVPSDKMVAYFVGASVNRVD